jgi:hypothetical protein
MFFHASKAILDIAALVQVADGVERNEHQAEFSAKVEAPHVREPQVGRFPEPRSGDSDHRLFEIESGNVMTVAGERR